MQTNRATSVAARAGSGFVINILTTFLRLAGAFQASGWLRLGSQGVATAATLLGFWIRPDLDGYFVGVGLTTVMAPMLAFGVAVPLVGRAHGCPLLRLPKMQCLGEFAADVNFLAKGSLVGIGKLLSRSGDLLVVAALTDDTTTGLYRVARQAYDTLSGLSDAVHQFYTPTIVDCLNRDQWAAFRRHRGRLMLIGCVAAAGAVLGSWLVLRPLAAARYPQYVPALPAFEIFAGLLVFNLGIHGWLWPMLIASGRIGWFGMLGIAGAVAQLGALGLLAWLAWLDIATAAATAWIVAAITYGPFLVAGISRLAAVRQNEKLSK